MGLFSYKKEPRIRPKDSYEVEVPPGYHVKKINDNKFEIEKDESTPVNAAGRPINSQ